MKKVLIVVGLFSILFPIKANALVGNVIVTCKNNNLMPGEETSCTIIGTSDNEVSAVSMTLNLGTNLTLTHINTDSSWQGDGENGVIELYTETNKNGKFPIATFSIKADKISMGASTNISVTNPFFTDASFTEHSVSTSAENIRIASTINTLNDLKINGETIEGFTKTKNDYLVSVLPSDKEIVIEGLLTDNNSSISGDYGVIAVPYGTTELYINITSESGAVNTYTITVTKDECRQLNSLIVNDINIDIKEGIYDYEITVENDVSNVMITGELRDTVNATFVNGYGPRNIDDLSVGNNEVLIRIMDINNEEITYKIIINRLDKKNNETMGNETVPNPKTGLGNYTLLGIIILIIGVIAYFIASRINNFSKSE